MSPVTDTIADPKDALSHFERLLAYETDCWDVHETFGPQCGYVLLDVRSEKTYRAGHVPGAVNLPHRQIDERALGQYPEDTLFVVYCSGTHCNGADRAAMRIARLGRKVKKMLGGAEGWRVSGFSFDAG